jgi:peptidoglycan hydrolase-like protein with peptidoglycan-binding domain
MKDAITNKGGGKTIPAMNKSTTLILIALFSAGFVFPFSVQAVTITRTLDIGSSGADVSSLQQALNQLGYLHTTPTGYFGSRTSQAVSAFQTANGLSPVGYVGPKTRILLSEIGMATSSGSTISTASGSVSGSGSATSQTTGLISSVSSSDISNALGSTLSYGTQGSSVTSLQNILFALGYLKAAPTGFFGQLTEAAVAAFQASNGLESVGYTGPQTRILLGSVLLRDLSGQSTGGTTSVTSQVAVVNPVTATTTIKTVTTTVVSSGGGGGGGGGVTTLPAPTLTFTGSSGSIAYNGSVTLTWSTTNAQSCTASGSWSGSQGTSGTITYSSLVANQAYTLSCAGTGGTVTGTINVTVAAAIAPTVTFLAGANPIVMGSSTSLTWSTTNATSCTGTGFTAGASSGSVTVSPTATTTYSILCGGPGGSASQSIILGVGVITVPPAPTLTFTTSSSSIAYASSATLTWSTTNATSCTASNGWTGSKSTSGSLLLTNLTSTTSYALTCTGAGGSTNQTVTITVAAQVLATLSASPQNISNGATFSTLTWTSSGASSCSINNSVGTVTPTSGGTTQVTPGSTTTYVITCTGGGGATANASTTVGIPTNVISPAYYVSPTGSNTNTGTSYASPWKTFTKAQAAMQGGSTKTTYLEGGTYTATTTFMLTTADNGESWLGYPGDSPIIDGGGTTQYAFFLRGTNQTVKSITMQNFYEGTLAIDSDATNADIENNTILNNGASYALNQGWNQAAIQSTSNYNNGAATNIRIKHNIIINSQGDGINIGGNNTTDITGLDIEYNLLQNTCTVTPDCGAIHTDNRLPLSTGLNSTGITIAHNVINNFGLNANPNSSNTPQSSCIYLDDFASNENIFNNICTGTGQTSFKLHAGSNNVFSNNIFDGSLSSQLAFYQGETSGSYTGPMTGNVFSCNIYYTNHLSLLDYHSEWHVSTATSYPAVANNDYWDTTGTLNGYLGTTIVDTNPFFVDPGFVSTSTGNYNFSGSAPSMGCSFSQIDVSTVGTTTNNLTYSNATIPARSLTLPTLKSAKQSGQQLLVSIQTMLAGLQKLFSKL